MYPCVFYPFVHTGLAKAEDKSRAHRSKKQEGSGSEDMRKKVVSTSTLNKEALSAVAHAAPGVDTGGLAGLPSSWTLEIGEGGRGRKWSLGSVLGV